MRKSSIVLATGFAVFVAAADARAIDWLTAPSTFTHDPASGERVSQYSPIGPFYIYPRADYVRSGYRQKRSTIQVGSSADHLHLVEEWGRPVRPYGEWRFPYRPYSVPYDLWGPPFGGLGNSGFGFGYGYGRGPYPTPYGGHGGGGYPGAGPYDPYGGHGFDPRDPHQWLDGSYAPDVFRNYPRGR